MVAIVRTEWSGSSGGPGLTQFAALGDSSLTAANAQSLVDATRAFWQALTADFPDELRLQVSPVVDLYNDATGELTGSLVAPIPPAVVAGTSGGSYAGGAGAKVTWNTGVIRNGRRVRGTTFLVPVSNGVFTTVGTITGAFVTKSTTAASNLIAAFIAGGAPLLIWSRPFTSKEGVYRPGASAGVLSGTMAVKSAILRGRRD